MFDRYSITVSASVLADRFQVEVPKRYKPRYNAGPSQLLPVITIGSAGLSYFYWGMMPEWAKNKTISEKIINVRAEQVNEKPMFRKKLDKFRCIVPCDGFYLWKKVGKKSNIPYRLFEKQKTCFSLAGFWEEFEDAEGENHHTFSIITKPSSPPILPIHERMPVILDKVNEKKWLAKDANESELLPIFVADQKIELDLYSVSPRIASLENDQPSLILPSAPADQHGNLTLFD